MVQVQSFTFNPFSENSYVLYDETGESVIIDPGCYEKEEEEELKAFILSRHLTVKLLLNTHCHIDHVLGNDFVKRQFKVPFLIHPDVLIHNKRVLYILYRINIPSLRYQLLILNAGIFSIC